MLAKNIYDWILFEKMENAQSYMEVGSFDGEGIAMLSKRFSNKRFYSIDPFIEDGNTVNSTNIKKGEPINEIRKLFLKNTQYCDNIIHFDMTSEEFIKQELYKNMFIDILFIDGDHSDKGTSIDLILAMLLSENKHLFVVIDDLYLDGVIYALDRFRIAHPEIEIKSYFDTINKVYTTAFFYLP
jgi:hypothetical protein